MTDQVLWSLAQDDCQFVDGICIQLSSDQTSLHFQATPKDKNWHNIDIEILWVLQKAEVALAQAAETIRTN